MFPCVQSDGAAKCLADAEADALFGVGEEVELEKPATTKSSKQPRRSRRQSVRGDEGREAQEVRHAMDDDHSLP